MREKRGIHGVMKDGARVPRPEVAIRGMEMSSRPDYNHFEAPRKCLMDGYAAPRVKWEVPLPFFSV